MPSITFMWSPRADAARVAPIIDELQTLAEARNVSFYVNAKEEQDTEPVVVNKDVSVSSDTMEHLRRLAARVGVTIYVNPA
jgi:hypothetical protein